MRIIKPTIYLIGLTKDFIKYGASMKFLRDFWHIEFLNFLESINLINTETKLKRFQNFDNEYLFKTPFGVYTPNDVNGYTVIQNNYEPETKQEILNNVNKNKNNKNNTFINIGCHIGRWLIEMAYVHNYKVIGFEPSPNTYETLKKNVKLSNIDNKTKIYNFALGDKEDILKFEYFKSHSGGSRVLQYEDAYTKYGNTIDVECKVFDNLKINSKDVRLMVIDVEGFEFNVLRGMAKFLKECKNIDIIIEIFENNPKRSLVLQLMAHYGFIRKKIDKDNWRFTKK